MAKKKKLRCNMAGKRWCWKLSCIHFGEHKRIKEYAVNSCEGNLCRGKDGKYHTVECAEITEATDEASKSNDE